MRKQMARLPSSGLALLLGSMGLHALLTAADTPAPPKENPGEAKASADSAVEIYTVSELLDRAETIVVAELGASGEAGMRTARKQRYRHPAAMPRFLTSIRIFV